MTWNCKGLYRFTSASLLVHESTLNVCLQETYNWCCRGIDVETGTKLVTFLIVRHGNASRIERRTEPIYLYLLVCVFAQDGLNGKTLSTATRSGYVRLIRTCHVNYDIEAETRTIQTLLKIAEKATGPVVGQVQRLFSF